MESFRRTWYVIRAMFWDAFLRPLWPGRPSLRSPQAFEEAWQEGQRRMDEHQWSEALAALDKAMSLMPRDRPDLTARLHFHKGYTLEQMRRVDQALAEYEACRASAEARPPFGPAARRRPSRAPEVLREGGTVERGSALSETMCLALFRQGYVFTQLGRWRQAEEKLRQCIQETQQVPVPKLRLSALRVLLGLYRATRSHAQAAQCAQEALQVARSLGDRPAEASLLDTAGDVAAAQNRAEDALCNYELSLDLFRRLQHGRAVVVVQEDIAKLYVSRGQWDTALAWLQVCLDEKERTQDLLGQAQVNYQIACLMIDNGELDEAAHLLLRSLGLFRRAPGGDKANIDQVGRTLMGLGVLIQRQATADQITYRDIERGSIKLKKEEEES